MKRWFRWTLIVLTVGGGFDGLVRVVADVYELKSHSVSDLLPLAGFVVLYIFTVCSGLLFADDARRTGPIVITLILQVPTFWSRFLSYRFTAGLYFLFTVSKGSPVLRTDGTASSSIEFGPSFHFGSDYWFFPLRDWPWGVGSVGINLFALAVLILLRKYTRKPNQSFEPPLNRYAEAGQRDY
jgi:hypothetical protein